MNDDQDVGFLRIDNVGPLIVDTNYWDSDLNEWGKLYCSVNGGAIRVLLPDSHVDSVTEMLALENIRHVQITRTHTPIDGYALLLEDDTDFPFVWQLSSKAFGPQPQPGANFRVSFWARGPRCIGDYASVWSDRIV